MAGYFDPHKRIWRKHKSKWIAIGFSDIVAIKQGRIIFFEVKTKIGKQSFDQKEFQRNVEMHDFEYHVVRSVEDARAVIQCDARLQRELVKVYKAHYEDCDGKS